MVIQIDSREKARAIQKIVAEFNKQGIQHPISKLYVGDYMNYDNPRLIIDRKQNLTELCSNVCQNHDRFRKEIVRATDMDIKLIFLCEHGKGIEKLTDVIWWKNPREEKRVFDEEEGCWKTIQTKAMKGETLYKILKTMERKYKCQFLFCEKKDTGKRIIELLSGDADDE